MSTIVGVFETLEQAHSAVAQLKQAGIPDESISLITLDDEGKNRLLRDSEIGAGIGALGGLLLAVAAVTVPGVGPVLVAGPLLAALGGASVGALAGGLIGALTEVGVPKDEAHRYAESVRRGHIVVTVRASGDGEEKARRILSEGKAGWTGHNAGAEPMSEDEIRREARHYAKDASPANEWDHMNEKEKRHTGHHPGHEGAEEETWPHKEAYDIGESLVDSAGDVSPSKLREPTRP